MASISQREKLLQLDKALLVDFILSVIPEPVIEARFWNDDVQKLERLKEEVDKAVMLGYKKAHDEGDGRHEDNLDTFTPVFSLIAEVFDSHSSELSKSSAESPFFVLSALCVLLSGLFQAGAVSAVCEESSYPLERLDALASDILEKVADKDSFSDKEEKIITHIAKLFSPEQLEKYQDFGMLVIDLQSGNLAKEILHRIRENVSSRKRVRTANSTNKVQFIDVSKV